MHWREKCLPLQYLEVEWMSAIPGQIESFMREFAGKGAEAVLIVEAKENSGSLITAGFALEQGKMVYAIPGAVTDALSRGCHKLIYDGAGIAYSPEIILEELEICTKTNIKSDEKNDLGLESDLNMVYSCLDLRPKNVDYIVRKTGFSPGQVSNYLIELMLQGLITECGKHYYTRT